MEERTIWEGSASSFLPRFPKNGSITHAETMADGENFQMDVKPDLARLTYLHGQLIEVQTRIS